MSTLPSNYCQTFSDLNKAIDMANWLNFQVRKHGCTPYFVVGKKDNHAVISDDVLELFDPPTHPLIVDYRALSYDEIQRIAMDEDVLKHWADIRGLFSIADGELLRYILAMQIPLEKFIRYELAIRGYDENHEWCGFEKARTIWFIENKDKLHGEE